MPAAFGYAKKTHCCRIASLSCLTGIGNWKAESPAETHFRHRRATPDDLPLGNCGSCGAGHAKY